VVLVDLVRVERLQHLEVGGAGLLLHQLRHEVGRERLQLVAPAQQAAQALVGELQVRRLGHPSGQRPQHGLVERPPIRERGRRQHRDPGAGKDHQPVIACRSR
jgi:hypothetical protein